MPDGGVRRVWATKANDHYFCAVEICNAEQEVARGRLFSEVHGAVDDVRRRADIDAWSSARFEQLRTHDIAAAFAFLGGDATARGALLSADPTLDSAKLG